MTNDPNVNEPVDAETPPAQPDPSDGGTPPPEDIDWKAQSRKWESLAKANKTAADKLAQLEDANKTEVQRATERAEQLAKELDGERRFRMQHEAATKAGLSSELAARLQGSTPEELAADAAALKALIPTQPQPNAFRDAQGKGGDTKSGDWLRDSLATR